MSEIVTIIAEDTGLPHQTTGKSKTFVTCCKALSQISSTNEPWCCEHSMKPFYYRHFFSQILFRISIKHTNKDKGDISVSYICIWKQCPWLTPCHECRQKVILSDFVMSYCVMNLLSKGYLRMKYEWEWIQHCKTVQWNLSNLIKQYFSNLSLEKKPSTVINCDCFQFCDIHFHFWSFFSFFYRHRKSHRHWSQGR